MIISQDVRIAASRDDAEDLKGFRNDLAKSHPTRLNEKPEFRAWPFWNIPLWAGAAAALLLVVP